MYNSFWIVIPPLLEVCILTEPWQVHVKKRYYPTVHVLGGFDPGLTAHTLTVHMQWHSAHSLHTPSQVNYVNSSRNHAGGPQHDPSYRLHPHEGVVRSSDKEDRKSRRGRPPCSHPAAIRCDLYFKPKLAYSLMANQFKVSEDILS